MFICLVVTITLLIACNGIQNVYDMQHLNDGTMTPKAISQPVIL